MKKLLQVHPSRVVVPLRKTYYHYICHPQTDCFVVPQLFSVTRHVRRLKLGSKPAHLYVRLCIIPLSQQSNHVSSGIIRHFVEAFVCLHFALLDTSVLNSFHKRYSLIFFLKLSFFSNNFFGNRGKTVYHEKTVNWYKRNS